MLYTGLNLKHKCTLNIHTEYKTANTYKQNYMEEETQPIHNERVYTVLGCLKQNVLSFSLLLGIHVF